MARNSYHRTGWKSGGFTLLEIAFVLLVVGIVASMLFPTVAGVHQKAMADEDRKVLTDLKDVLIGQFLATGKLPACRDNAGVISVTGNCNAAYSVGDLGIRITDSRNTPVRYDVWNVGAGTDLTNTDLTTVCTALDTAIAHSFPPTVPAVPPLLTGGPATCSQSPDYLTKANFGTYCTTANNVAFVLVGEGLNRAGQSGEVALTVGTVLGNRNIGLDRFFENPGRRHNTSLPDKRYYDDLMEVVTFQQLRTAINKSCP